MTQRGYVLVEMLLTAILFSIAATGLFFGLIQGIKVEQHVRLDQRNYDPMRSFSMRIEKDLRNSIQLKEYPFQGKVGEMSFPVLETDEQTDHHKIPRLSLIQYFLKDRQLIRSRQEITNQLVQPKPESRVMLKQTQLTKFFYAYLNENEKLIFLPYWLEEPYSGIPRAIKIEMEPGSLDHVLTELISIPQGRFGRPQDSGLPESVSHE